jgi:N-acyl amino acid synthase of PEP-CTERM/exosortase system
MYDRTHMALTQFIREFPVTRAAYRALAGYLFHRYFSVVSAASDQLRNEVFRIRYDVYCAELGFEDPTRFPDQKEIDPFDDNSYHCLLLHRPTGVFAGCVRLVATDPNHPEAPLPFERLCHNSLDEELLRKLVPDRSKIGEISRLAVRASYRRRAGESATPAGIVNERNEGRFRRTSTPWIALGLYFSAAAIGLIKGLEGVFALMEPRLARRLRTYGLNFVQVAQPVEHRGLRAPYFISKRDLFTGVPPILRGLLEVIEADLRATGAVNMTLRKSREMQKDNPSTAAS